VPSDDVMRGLYFQTNFEIVHMNFARSRSFQAMFDAFDGTEVTVFQALVYMYERVYVRSWTFESWRTAHNTPQGFLTHRFGDANVRFFQVLSSLQVSQLLQVVVFLVVVFMCHFFVYHSACRHRCPIVTECSVTECRSFLFKRKMKKAG
jgi:hypothetical protein